MMEKNREKNEKRDAKILEMCDELGLTQEEKEAALAFLSGEAGEEVLEKIKFRDLAGANSNAFQVVVHELIYQEKKDDNQKICIKNLFLLLFAIGEATCSWLLSKTYIGYRQFGLSGADAAKVTAVCVASIGRATYRVTAYVMEDLMSVAKKDPEVLQRAMGYGKGLGRNARLVLFAAYFWQKYQSDGKAHTIKREDQEQMQQYETMLAEALCHFYDNGIGEKKQKELLSGIASGRIPEEFLSCRGKTIGQLFRLIAGTAYFNYPLSKKLEDIVRICMAVNDRETLDVIRVISSGYPLDIQVVGGHYDRFFGIDSESYINWAKEKSFVEILKEQAACNQEAYLSVLEKAQINDACWMLSHLEAPEPALHKKLVEEKRKDYKERVIEELTKKDIPADGDAARLYLRGDCGMESLFNCFLNDKRSTYHGGYEYAVLRNYDLNFKDEEFFRRCEVYMVFRRASAAHFFSCRIADEKPSQGNKVDPERVRELFRDLNEEGLPMYYQVLAVNYVKEGLDGGTEEDFLAGVNEYFSGCLKERREETVDAFTASEVYARQVGLRLLNQDADGNKNEILKYMQDSSKAVKEELFEILCAKKEWEAEIKEFVSSKKAAQREFAIRVLSVWQAQGADYRELFAQAMEKEKNAKVRELLGNLLGEDGKGAAGGTEVISRGELVKSLHKGGRKRSLAWAYETPFSAVHFAGDGKKEDNAGGAEDGKKEDTAGNSESGRKKDTAGTAGSGKNRDAAGNAENEKKETAGKMPEKKAALKADEEYLQAILLCYASAKDASVSAKGASALAGEAPASSAGGISKNAEFLADALCADELAVYVNELFEKWLAAGAESKKRWVLYAAAIHGGSNMVAKLERHIREWPKESRGAIACEAVKALSLSPLPQALLIVDGIARKFKFKQVRAAANDALLFAAAQLGITREELADRIVPNLGFDENLERLFDYGPRAFLITITPELEIEVYEAKQEEADGQEAKNKGGADGAAPAARGMVRGKKLKNLPAPGAKDDVELAKTAYDEFKQLKKQMKATAASQTARLEMALSTAREWKVGAWKQLFVKNPVMHQFATRLIWGIYENGKLLQSFRYMEDGSFNTAEEEEYELPDNGRIGLVHPMELTGEEKEAWEQQLEDYEIVQPFEQLKRSVYTVTKEEEGEQKLMRFHGRTINDLSLNSRLTGLGWYRGSVQDGGGFDTYYREDAELGLGVELHFSGSYVGGSYEDVTVYDARFYRAGTIKRGSYQYDEADEDKAFRMGDIPARYFSEIVWQLTKVMM
mgnify:CR=1 FL=1